MAQYGFYFDQTVCAGCHTCQIACKDKNRLDVGYLYRTVHTYENGEYPKPGLYHMAVSCNHCDEPACVAACPVGRTIKDEETGIVYHDANVQCLGEGCQACVNACPYGHPVLIESENRVGKCNMCKDLIDQGQEPACVASCMMRALKFGPVDELKATYGEDLVTELPCFPDGGTKPNFLIKAAACALEADFEEKES
jgi:anaerobic dimethyl sulfoxide reductase subunit B (iron-sulfur subunit)